MLHKWGRQESRKPKATKDNLYLRLYSIDYEGTLEFWHSQLCDCELKSTEALILNSKSKAIFPTELVGMPFFECLMIISVRIFCATREKTLLEKTKKEKTQLEVCETIRNNVQNKLFHITEGKNIQRLANWMT